MPSTSTPVRAVEILTRTIEPEDGRLSPDAARAFLRFRLSAGDVRRVDSLAARARSGELTDEERSELDDYELITALFEILQSKARHSLQQAGLSA